MEEKTIKEESSRLPINGRRCIEVTEYGHTYILIEGDEQRKLAKIPDPCFRGHAGFALREMKR